MTRDEIRAVIERAKATLRECDRALGPITPEQRAEIAKRASSETVGKS